MFKLSSKALENKLKNYEKIKDALVKREGSKLNKNNIFMVGEKEYKKNTKQNKVKVQQFLERMEDDFRRKQVELEELEDEKYEKIEDECPFTPNLTNVSRKIMSNKKTEPIYNR